MYNSTMKFNPVTVVVLLYLTSTAKCESESCPLNEEYSTCGSACPATCQDKSPVCIATCVPGCICKKGYIREYKGGRCVPETCANVPVCPVNEEYTRCGSACPASCQNPNPQVCSTRCVPGCVCKPGYLRTGPGGLCVPKSCENVPVCRREKNEVFSVCASCPTFCNRTGVGICPAICRPGCNCIQGYVRSNRRNPVCIPEANCRTECGENQVYRECGTMCPGTCSQPFRVCDGKCVKGCFCKTGYVLDDVTRRCIKREYCPK